MMGSRQSPMLASCGRIAWTVAAFFLATASIAGFARAGNIFDEDWTPPKALEPDTKPHSTPAPAPNPASQPPIAPKPQTQPDSSSDASNAPAAQERRKVPAASEQSKSRSLLKEAFAKQLDDRSPAGRRKLVDLLTAEAAKDSDRESDQFVLLAGAITSAEEAGDLKACFAVADEAAKLYELSALAIKTDAALKMPAKNYQLNTATNVEAGLGLMDELAAAENFALAERLTGILERAAASDASLRTSVRKRIKAFDSLHGARVRIQPAVDKLRSAPDDQTANFTVGSYLCFRAGQWEKGLPLLSRGTDATIRRLASDELANPADADAVAQVADGWWDGAQKQPEPTRTAILHHAGELYSRVVEKVAGLKRTIIEKRIAQTELAESNGVVNLLSLVRPDKHAVAGEWRIENGALVCASTWASRIEFPYVPPDEYDFRVSFEAKAISQAFGQICSAHGHQFAWTIAAWSNTISGFELINGKMAKSNSTCATAKQWLVVGTKYVTVVKVRKTGVEAWLNGQKINAWKTNFSDMSLDPGSALKHPNTLGLVTFAEILRIESIEVVEISGPGQLSQ